MKFKEAALKNHEYIYYTFDSYVDVKLSSSKGVRIHLSKDNKVTRFSLIYFLKRLDNNLVTFEAYEFDLDDLQYNETLRNEQEFDILKHVIKICIKQ